MSLTLVQTSP